LFVHQNVILLFALLDVFVLLCKVVCFINCLFLQAQQALDKKTYSCGICFTDCRIEEMYTLEVSCFLVVVSYVSDQSENKTKGVFSSVLSRMRERARQGPGESVVFTFCFHILACFSMFGCCL
jgi:hypothetical protein